MKRNMGAKKTYMASGHLDGVVGQKKSSVLEKINFAS